MRFKYFKTFNTFIHHIHMNLIENGSKDIYNITKDLYFK